MLYIESLTGGGWHLPQMNWSTSDKFAGVRLDCSITAAAFCDGHIDHYKQKVGWLENPVEITNLSDRKVAHEHLNHVQNFQVSGSVTNIDLDARVRLPLGSQGAYNVWTGKNYRPLVYLPGGRMVVSDWQNYASKQKYCNVYCYFCRRQAPTRGNRTFSTQVAWVGITLLKRTDHQQAHARWSQSLRCVSTYSDRGAEDHCYVADSTTPLWWYDPYSYDPQQVYDELWDLFVSFTTDLALTQHKRKAYSSSPRPDGPRFIPNWAFGRRVPREAYMQINPDLVFPRAERNPAWDDLARDAYDDLGFWDGNGIALLKDIAEMKSAVHSTLQTVKSLGQGKLAAVANLFLAFHYGWKLLAMDVKDLAESLDTDVPIRRCRAHTSWNRTTGDITRSYFATYMCNYEAYGQIEKELDKFQSMLDLNLTVDNIWDLIPFSFVVDWFIGIGDVCTSINNYFNLRQEHLVLNTERSIKCTEPTTPASIGLSGWFGQLDVTYYVREYLNRPIDPSLAPSVPINALPNHFVEGAALIVSRF